MKTSNKIVQVILNNKIATAIYLGVKLVWNSIRSCFGNGYWDNDQVWNNDESWNNG